MIVDDAERATLVLRRPGVHTLLDATAAVLAATLVGVPLQQAADAVATFSGVHRRFEHRGDARGATFIDDYAHHPTELLATLAAAARAASRRVIAVFQPHRYSRTQKLWRELGESLAGADVVVVTDVYGAGEQPIPGVTGKLLVDALSAARWAHASCTCRGVATSPPSCAARCVPATSSSRWGAGDVTMVADEVLERIEETG